MNLPREHLPALRAVIRWNTPAYFPLLRDRLLRDPDSVVRGRAAITAVWVAMNLTILTNHRGYNLPEREHFDRKRDVDPELIAPYCAAPIRKGVTS